MRQRLFQHRHNPKDQPEPEDEARHHRQTDPDPAVIPADILALSQYSATRDLRQQAVLQMQQRQGNAAVQRYLADIGALAAPAVQREDKGGNNWGDDADARVTRRNVMLLTIVGEKQGQFKGNSKIAGQGGKIECSQFSMSVSVPGDKEKADKSFTTVKIGKETDGTSAQFFQALTQNETLKSVRVEVGNVDLKGAFKPNYLVDFQAGKVSKMQVKSPNNVGGSGRSTQDTENLREMDDITMLLGPYPRASNLRDK